VGCLNAWMRVALSSVYEESGLPLTDRSVRVSAPYDSAVPSDALGGLTGPLRDVDQLMAANKTVGGLEPGRRYDVEGLNRAAVLMLCPHFEGY
jgi:hypothetical protein